MDKSTLAVSLSFLKRSEAEEISRLGLDVFDCIEKFDLWLQTSCIALGNKKPMELLTDSYGKEKVIDELIRINHGILT